MNLAVQFQHMLAAERVPIRLPDHRQIPESEFIETICDAIEMADRDQFSVIRGAISNVRSAVNRQSLRMMLEDREREIASEPYALRQSLSAFLSNWKEL